MQFNPLFIQPVNQADTADAPKQSKLNNSSYLFSDIIRIINESPADTKQASTLVNDSGDNSLGYQSLENNFRYQMFVTLAGNNSLQGGSSINNLNLNGISNLLNTTISGANANSSVLQLNAAGIKNLLNEIASLLLKLGIKPGSIDVSSQTGIDSLQSLLQEITSAAGKSQKSDGKTDQAENKTDKKTSKEIQNIASVLFSLLQTNKAVDLNFKSGTENIKLEITNTDANGKNTVDNLTSGQIAAGSDPASETANKKIIEIILPENETQKAVTPNLAAVKTAAAKESASEQFVIKATKISGGNSTSTSSADILNELKKSLGGNNNESLNVKIEIKNGAASQQAETVSTKLPSNLLNSENYKIASGDTSQINQNANNNGQVINSSVQNQNTAADKNVDVKQTSVSSSMSSNNINSTQNYVESAKSGQTFSNDAGNSSGNDKQKDLQPNQKNFDAQLSALNLDKTLSSIDTSGSKVLSSQLHTPDAPAKLYRVPEALKEISNMISSGDTKSAVLQLKPEDLGKVKVTLEVTNNIVHARIDVDNETVRQIVQNNLIDLKQSLHQSGMQLNSFSVNVSNGEQKQSKSFLQKKKTNIVNGNIGVNESSETLAVKSMGYNTYEFLA